MKTSPIAGKRLMAGLAGLGLLLAACGSDDARANPTTTTATPGSTTMTAPAPTEPTTTATEATAATTPPSSTSTTTTAPPTTNESITTSDEGQDTPVINDWRLDVESLPCEESDLPGSPGGEAVLPASWAAGNADYVEFLVDGDLRAANSVREVAGPGNIQVPCNPALNDGHQIVLVAYTGNPGDPGPETVGEALIVVTTATKDN